MATVDMTYCIMTVNVGKGDFIEAGDIVHVEPMTGLTSVNKRHALLHVTGIPEEEFGSFETRKELYTDRLRASVDGKMEEVKYSKHYITDTSVLFRDKNETIPWEKFKSILAVKTVDPTTRDR